jgi:8-oxo-dGTP pyrophosphatase MutT (NUDIX family)
LDPQSLWTTLRLVRLRLESGDVVDREVEDHGDAVAVLPFDPLRRTALLVRVLSAPAFLSGGLTETARREAYEKVGVRLRELEHTGRVWTSPGISTEMMDSEVTELSLDTLWTMAERKEIDAAAHAPNSPS